jgi:uncharacterized protein YndB with AHSA1/START domain
MLIWSDTTPEAIGEALKWIAIVGGGLAGVLFLIALLGCFCPRSYTASRTLESKRAPSEVWNVVSDLSAMPSWHPEFAKAEKQPAKEGRAVWRVTDKRGYSLQLETLEASPPHKLIQGLADDNGPFSGEWDFTFEPAGDGCKVTLTERGQIPNPFFRVMFWTFMTPTFYLEMYLRALAKKLGDS